jgi:hypothetical protein
MNPTSETTTARKVRSRAVIDATLLRASAES